MKNIPPPRSISVADRVWTLKNRSKKNMGFDYYYKMGFEGLLKDGTTQPIKEVEPMIPNGNWQEVEQILSNEALGTPAAKGKKENCN